MERPDWDDYFLAIAEVVSHRADCVRRQVGAVIVKHNRIVSTGYNGAPAGEDGCLSNGACPRAHSLTKPYTNYDDPKSPGYCIAVHAEANALLYADRANTEGATLYCTDAPCGGCDKLIRGAGIVRVVTF